MIRSMTAFARQECQEAWGRLSWEIRSVNHRYLEPSFRMPEEFRALEPRLRDLVNKRLSRGKVECNLRFHPSLSHNTELTLNSDLARQVVARSQEVAAMMNGPASVSPLEILRWPGVMDEPETDLGPLHEKALELMGTALEELIETREREGSRMAEIIEARLAGMETQVKQVAERQPQVIALQRQKLLDRLGELAEQAEPGRLEQEMAIQAQKLDIAEELDRLTTHLDEVRRNLKASKPVGRRLDFLMQELNREANTTGSKSIDSEVTQCSVEMKVLIEQMREQVQNIE